MKIFDVYGSKTGNIDKNIEEVFNSLQIKLKLHESSYSGEYLRAEIPSGGNIKLIPNFHEGDWHEEDYKEYLWILEINNVKTHKEIEEKLSSSTIFEFLFRVEIESKKWIKRYTYINGLLTKVSEENL